MRRRGLFGDAVGGREDEAEALEFGYCFDVSALGQLATACMSKRIIPYGRGMILTCTSTGGHPRFFPRLDFHLRHPVHSLAIDIERLLVHIHSFGTLRPRFANEIDRISIFFGNTLYLVAFVYYNIIIFLGFNGKISPFYNAFKTSEVTVELTRLLNSNTVFESHGVTTESHGRRRNLLVC